MRKDNLIEKKGVIYGKGNFLKRKYKYLKKYIIR